MSGTLPGSPTTNADGQYTATVDYGWSGFVTPTLGGYTFTPASSTYTNVTANQTTDYVATPATYSLTVLKAGTGAGTVTSDDGGINCGGTCQKNYNYGTNVKLTAAWAPGSTFAGWSGDVPAGQETANPVTITVDGNKNLTATFNLAPALVITTASVPDGIKNTAYDTTLQFAGGVPPLTWSVSSGALPAGLSLNPGTGQINGTPTESGYFSFVVEAHDISLQTGTQALSITIADWVARYNGPGNAWDGGQSCAVDSLGNIYVTGSSVGDGTNYDYATFKYNSSGVQQWGARYSGVPGTSDDWGNAVAVDALGNVYVTGWSMGSGTNQDYATIKYNSSGVEQWVARYDGPGNYFDLGQAIAVDSSGNVYVTGRSVGSGTSDDYATIKYDSAGVEQWVARHNGPGNSEDEASAIAVDSSGNVYVTGRSMGSGTNQDYATIKYSSSGVEQWVARHNGPGNSEDEASAIAVDSSGNVYVTGWSMGSGTNQDYATIKYNSSGVEQWVARHNGPGNSEDEASAIAVDSSGNVYVTGRSMGSGTNDDYATIKYSQSFPSTLIISTETLDNGSAGTPYAKALWAFGGSGSRAWLIIGGALPPGMTLDTATGIISGTPTTPGTYNFTVQIVDGSLTATKPLSITISTTVGPPHKLAFSQQPSNTAVGATMTPAVTVEIQDSAGNLVTTATNMVKLSLLNANGAVLSGTLSRAAAGGVATFGNLSIDKLGTGYALKAESGSLTEVGSSAFDITAAAASQILVETAPDGSGTVVPAQNIGTDSSITVYAIARSAANTFIENVAADSWSLVNKSGGVVDGDLVPAGEMKSATFTGHSVGSGQIHAAKSGLTSVDSGVLTVLETYEFITKWGVSGTGDGQFSNPYGVAVDSSGNVYVTDGGNYRIQKFSSSGTFLGWWGLDDIGDTGWHDPGSGRTGVYGDGDGELHTPLGITVDNSDNVYVADRGNSRIQKFTPDGVLLAKWGSYGTGDGQFMMVRGVAVDSSGNVYVTDDGNGRIQKFTSTGNLLGWWGLDDSGYTGWHDPDSGRTGVSGDGDGQFHWPHGIALDTSGDVYVADYYNNRIQKFTSAGVFITKWGSGGAGDGQIYSPCGLAVDSSGNIYVVDNGNERIQKFTSAGGFISKWGSPGSEDGQFDFPWGGVAVDSSGIVYVADSNNNRIQIFQKE